MTLSALDILLVVAFVFALGFGAGALAVSETRLWRRVYRRGTVDLTHTSRSVDR